MHSISPITAPVYRITGRSLNRQLRNGSAAERDHILRDLRGGRSIPTDLTNRQLEHLVASCLVGMHRPPDEKKLRARLDRKADRAVEQLGIDAIWRAVEQAHPAQLPLMAAE